MNWTVHCADVLTWCEDYAAKIERGEAEPFHGILTDPSYGLGDNPDIEALLTAWMSGEDYDTGPGFMQRDWDQLPSPRYWAALRSVCYPGAYLFAFGGTRTADLLSVAIRLGGWERFDEIDSLSWCYGQGFPKNHAIGKAIDREKGNKREVIGYRDGRGDYDGKERTSSAFNTHWRENEGRSDVIDFSKRPVTLPASELAEIWNGHGTSLKPAHEPILCFRNPKQGTYAANCLSTGAGALNIDGSRVAGVPRTTHKDGNHNTILTSKGIKGGAWANPVKAGQWQWDGEVRNGAEGRWPPNVLLTHIPPRPDGNGGWLPGCERLGVKRVRGHKGYPDGPKGKSHHYSSEKRSDEVRPNEWTHPSTAPDGTEAVTAYACVLACDACGHQWTAEQRGACPECGGEARWACAVRELAEQSGESKSPKPYDYSGKPENTKHVYGKGLGWGQGGHATEKGDKGTAARFYPQFTWQHEIAERLAGVVPFRYQAKAGRAQRDAGLEEFTLRQVPHGGHGNDEQDGLSKKMRGEYRNPHPCCKPISLISDFLAKLLLPPPEYAPRRILVPFAGSGSEMIGCLLAGFDEVVGVEMSEEYCDIARARLRFWADWAARGYDEPAAILKAAKREEERQEVAQMELL